MRYDEKEGYVKHPSLEHDHCYYCERYAITVDHVPPWSRRNETVQPRWLIRCCCVCNIWAGNTLQNSLEERKQELLKCWEERLAILDWIRKNPECLRKEIEEVWGLSPGMGTRFWRDAMWYCDPEYWAKLVNTRNWTGKNIRKQWR